LNNNGKEFGKQLVLDEKIRTYLLKEFNDSQIDRIEIEKKTKLNSFDKEKNDTLNIVIYCCQIGLINDEKNQLATMYIQKLVGRKIKVNLAVVDFGNPN
jgi:ribosomal protein S3